MKKIRRNIFETNSSSTHSLTMCVSDEFERWKNGEFYWNRYGESFITKDEVMDKYNKLKSEEDDFNEWRVDYGYLTYDEFHDYDILDFETFEQEMETKNGEKVISFGYYGYDG